MRLKNYYYRLCNSFKGDRFAVFHIALINSCDVFSGHFPGNPVCPGVLSIQIIKELTETLTDRKLRIGTVKQCRFLDVASPSASPHLDVEILIKPADDGYEISSEIKDDHITYVDFKGTMAYD